MPAASYTKSGVVSAGVAIAAGDGAGRSGRRFPRLGLNFGFAGNRDVGGHRGDHIVRVGAPRATTGDPARRRRGIPDPEERIIAVGCSQNLRRPRGPGTGRATGRPGQSESEADRRDEECSHTPPVPARNLPVRRTARQAGRRPGPQASALFWNVVGVKEDSFRSFCGLFYCPALPAGAPSSPRSIPRRSRRFSPFASACEIRLITAFA
jgi:hypothetical protein